MLVAELPRVVELVGRLEREGLDALEGTLRDAGERAGGRHLEEPGDAFDGPLQQADMGALINKIIAAGHDVKVFHTTGNWIDCDSALDAIAGSQFQ